MADFELFCRTYYPSLFYLPWSDYHKRTAQRIQQTVDDGGWYARALPRGGGKTTLCKCGITWATLRGAKKYPVIFAATEGLAGKLLHSIKMQLLTNPLLYEDFPHTIHAIRHLKNQARKAGGQHWGGALTFIEWGASRIVLPWIEHESSTANGVVIEAYGIESASRGLSCDTPRGDSVRPDIALADDPQTRASAKSPSQTKTRLDYLTGDVAYLAGPGKPMAVFCTCTVMYEGDLADQILNTETNPEWSGERTKLVEKFPEDLSKWDSYAEKIRECWRNKEPITAATEMYLADRHGMDDGFRVSWEHRYDPGEASAIQHAMNRRIRNEAMFFAEYQNEPMVVQDDFELLSADEICAKTTNCNRGDIPSECSVVTAFTDVQMEHLFWMVCAWTPDFTGYILDYGAWPEQKRNYFTRRDIRKKLTHVYGGDENAVIYSALTDLGNKLAGATYRKLDGTEIPFGRWCVDIGYRPTPITAYAEQSEFRNVIALTRGVGVTATMDPFSDAERARKWKTSHGHWFWKDGPGPARKVRFDANHWKTRIHRALRLPANSRGSIQLFKASPQIHRMLADHLRAEKASKVEAKGRTVFQWTEIPGMDNEGLDNLVGCALGASICGIAPEVERALPKQAPALSLADYARMAGR